MADPSEAGSVQQGSNKITWRRTARQISALSKQQRNATAAINRRFGIRRATPSPLALALVECFLLLQTPALRPGLAMFRPFGPVSLNRRSLLRVFQHLIASEVVQPPQALAELGPQSTVVRDWARYAIAFGAGLGRMFLLLLTPALRPGLAMFRPFGPVSSHHRSFLRLPASYSKRGSSTHRRWRNAKAGINRRVGIGRVTPSPLALALVECFCFS